MTRYRVFVHQVVGHYVDVEADSKEEALDAAGPEGLHGLMFLNHEYPEEGGWEPMTKEIRVPASSIEDTVIEI